MNPNSFISRRELLTRSGFGLGLLGLAQLASAENSNPLAAKKPHFAAKAKHVVHLFMNGGPSQVDTFDPKPLLEKYHGKPLPTLNLRTERKTGAAMKSPFRFDKYGRSGLEVSELFAETAKLHSDDMCVIRSLHAEVPNHEPSLMLMNCGDARQVRFGPGEDDPALLGGDRAALDHTDARPAFRHGRKPGAAPDAHQLGMHHRIRGVHLPVVHGDAQHPFCRSIELEAGVMRVLNGQEFLHLISFGY